MNRISASLIVLGLLLVPASLFAQLEEEVQVNLMEIWVKVTDSSGNAVTDLNPSDFHIFVDGEELAPRCFDSTFRSSRGEAAIADNEFGTPMEKGRKFIFFFDMLNTMPGDMDYLKGRLKEFLQTSFRENDQAMVFALLPSVHLGLVQKWTSDKYSLMGVINKIHGNMTLKSTFQANERQLLELLYQPDTTNDQNPGQSRGVGARPMEGLQQARLLARNLASQDASRSRLTLNSFLSIASYLSGFPMEERPVLLYISGGFPLYPGQYYYEIVQKAVEDRYVQGPGDLASIERPSVDFQTEVRNVIGRLNRLNVTIYTVDAKGLLTSARGAERTSGEIQRGMNFLDDNHQLQDSLVLIARETGGTAMINSQDYARGFNAIARDLEDQYWLCVNLPATAKRNVYHKVEVKVDRPDVKVRHRKGYVE